MLLEKKVNNNNKWLKQSSKGFLSEKEQLTWLLFEDAINATRFKPQSCTSTIVSSGCKTGDKVFFLEWIAAENGWIQPLENTIMLSESSWVSTECNLDVNCREKKKS